MEDRVQELADRAIFKFGREHQLKIITEELAELIVAIAHFERNKADYEDLAREIADVEIGITQLKKMTLTEFEYQKILSEKLDKLESYL